MNREQYIQKHERRIKLFEQQFLKPVFNAVHSQVLDFVHVIKSDGLSEAKRKLDEIILNEKVEGVIREMYLTIGAYFYRKTTREIGREEKKGFGQNDDWVQALVNYFKGDLLTRAVLPISETTKEQIRELLIKAENEGWGVDQIIRELESSELTAWRARLIVRTETIKAMFYGQKKAQFDSPFETVEIWIAARDYRTRHSHRQVDGATITTGERFVVPVYKKFGKMEVHAGVDYMEGPGDPKAHIENLANCRCTKVTRAKRDENGRLIRKQLINV